tara:strand:- start:1281 stop:1484 length:204 start_codon:yes stop_codon:yes gene_type:complete
MADLKSIGLAIMRARQAKGMSQEDLAGIADVARNYISRIENGHVSFSVPVLLKITEALEIIPEELFK